MRRLDENLHNNLIEDLTKLGLKKYVNKIKNFEDKKVFENLSKNLQKLKKEKCDISKVVEYYNRNLGALRGNYKNVNVFQEGGILVLGLNYGAADIDLNGEINSTEKKVVLCHAENPVIKEKKIFHENKKYFHPFYTLLHPLGYYPSWMNLKTGELDEVLLKNEILKNNAQLSHEIKNNLPKDIGYYYHDDLSTFKLGPAEVFNKLVFADVKLVKLLKDKVTLLLDLYKPKLVYMAIHDSTFSVFEKIFEKVKTSNFSNGPSKNINSSTNETSKIYYSKWRFKMEPQDQKGAENYKILRTAMIAQYTRINEVGMKNLRNKIKEYLEEK